MGQEDGTTMNIRSTFYWGIGLLSLGLLLIAGVTVMVFVTDCDDDKRVDQPNATTQQR
jgi:hypothetical protein